MTTIANTVHNCHAHRDIKPENIFLSEDWTLKLGDFGLALDANQELPFTRSGTLDYMAPEVLANPATTLTEGKDMTVARLMSQNVKPYNEKVDIWAVGILCYELIVGRPPFEVENEQYTMSLIMNSNNINFPTHFSKGWSNFVSMVGAHALCHTLLQLSHSRAAQPPGICRC